MAWYVCTRVRRLCSAQDVDLGMGVGVGVGRGTEGQRGRGRRRIRRRSVSTNGGQYHTAARHGGRALCERLRGEPSSSDIVMLLFVLLYWIMAILCTALFPFTVRRGPKQSAGGPRLATKLNTGTVALAVCISVGVMGDWVMGGE